jgi:hypothetical protein
MSLLVSRGAKSLFVRDLGDFGVRAEVCMSRLYQISPCLSRGPVCPLEGTVCIIYYNIFIYKKVYKKISIDIKQTNSRPDRPGNTGVGIRWVGARHVFAPKNARKRPPVSHLGHERAERVSRVFKHFSAVLSVFQHFQAVLDFLIFACVWISIQMSNKKPC